MAQRVTVLGCTPSTCATSARVNTSGPVILRATTLTPDPVTGSASAPAMSVPAQASRSLLCG